MHPVRPAILLLVLGGTLACGNDGSPAPPVTGAPPTHDFEVTEEALFRGTLGGTLDCIWISTADGRRSALVLPAGTTTEQQGDDIVVITPDGTATGRTGDPVDVGGGYHPVEPSCLAAGETGVIQAGPISPATDADD